MHKHISNITNAITTYRDAINALEAKKAQAEATTAAWAASPTSKSLERALISQMEHDAISRIQARLRETQRAENGIADNYTTTNAAEICAELETAFITATKPRESYRKREAGKLAKLAEQIAIGDLEIETLSRLETEQDRIESAMATSDAQIQNARRAINAFRVAPSFQAMKEANEITSAIIFPA